MSSPRGLPHPGLYSLLLALLPQSLSEGQGFLVF